MIVYQLACPQDHFFEGWFASAAACEKQAAEGHLSCPTCASVEVRKLPAAPYVKVIAALRKHLLANTEDVGRQFAEVARRIHYQEEKARAIRGQATVDEALGLHEEGIEAYAIAPGVLPPENTH
jgi:hypothetical protein